MATENSTEGVRTPIKQRFETFNICFGGALGVGKTTLFEYLKSDRFVERSSDEARETGVDVSRLERQVDGTDIKVRSGRCTCSSQAACVFLVRAVLPFLMHHAVSITLSSVPPYFAGAYYVRLQPTVPSNF